MAKMRVFFNNFAYGKTVDEKYINNFPLRKEYRKNQEKVFWTVFLAYMVFYLTRKQWIVFGSVLTEDDKLLTKGNFALVNLIFGVVYGISKFLSSPLSDTKSNKLLLGCGLIGAGVINLAIGFTWMKTAPIITPIIITCILMVINGWVHSFGATPSVRLLYNWFNNKNRRSRIVMWNVSHNIGSALATFTIIGSYTLFSNFLNRTAYFVLPSVISLIVGLIVIILIKDSPTKIGLPSLQKYYNMQLIGQTKKGIQEAEKPWKYYFIKYVLKNKYVWMLAVANLLIYTLRMGISTWSLQFLKEYHNFDVKKQGKWIYSMFDWGGLIWTLIVGLLANKYLKRFAPITMLVIIIATLGVAGIWLAPIGGMWQLALFMTISGFIFIPQCFLPIMVSEFSHHRVVATAAGVLGVSGYIGDSVISTVVIGYGLLNISWNAVYIFLIVCGVTAALLLLPMFKKKLSL